MRVNSIMRCVRLKILGPLFFAFMCFTLLSEIFRWRKKWDSVPAPHSFRHGGRVPSGGRLFQPPPVVPNRTNFVPGQFLKGVFPKNESYCHFGYGTPEHFNWTDKYMAFSPELGELGPYRVIYNVIKVSDSKASNGPVTNFGVTYCTHATPEFLYHVVEIVRRWDGPVSLAVYAPCTDAGFSLAIMHQLCRCLPEMSKLSVHLIFPITHPPVFTLTAFPSSDVVKYPTLTDCSAPETLIGGKLKTFRQREGLTYPVNVGRNVARKAAQTSHVLVSDVELLPSRDLVSAFLSMLLRFQKQHVEGHGTDVDLNPPLPIMQESRMKNFVFVLPVFEVDEKESNVPNTKEELLELYTQNKAVYFHRWVCLHCQRFPGLQRWLQRKPSAEKSKVIQPLLVVRREFPYHRWEPIYIGTNEEPLYSEELTWEGQQDKMTQMNEMCLKGYRFVILDGAFLVHVPGIKRRSEVTVERAAWRHPHERHNIKMYHSITVKMMRKYGTNTRCKL